MTAARTITIGGTWTPLYYQRASSGDDGKYTTDPVTGERIQKWNAYSLDLIHARRVLSPSGYYPSPISCLLTWTNNDENVLLGKLMKKTRETSFDAGVFLGTAHQSLQTVFGTIGMLTRVAREVRHGNMAMAARMLGASPRKGFRDANKRQLDTKDVASRWLELQYGWLPLLDDVHEAAELYEKMTQPPRKKIVHASHFIVNYGQQSLATAEVDVVGKRTVRLSYEAKEKLDAPRQMNLISPGLLAWELLPYSFIVDWFIPIGSYISNYEQIPVLKGRFLRSDTQEWDSVGYGKDTSYNHFYVGSRVNQKTVIYRRTVPASLTVPYPQFAGFGGLKNGNRLWNALALFRLQLGTDKVGDVADFRISKFRNRN